MENILKTKSLAFAIRIVKLTKFLQIEKKEFILTKQLLRSGTAIGALICEAEYAESKLDFIHKNAIAQKESNETIYWLTLLRETEYLTNKEYKSINDDVVELMRLLTSSIKTTKSNLKKD